MASENETVQGLTVELWPIYELKDDKWRPCANIVVRYNNEIIDLKDTNFDYYFDQHPVRRFRDVTDLKTGAHNFKCVVTYKGETKISSVDAYFNELTQSECIPNTPIVPEVPDVPPTSEPDEPTEPTTPVETKAKLPNYIKYPYLARGSFNPKTAEIGRTYYTQWIKIVPTQEELDNEHVDLIDYLGEDTAMYLVDAKAIERVIWRNKNNIDIICTLDSYATADIDSTVINRKNLAYHPGEWAYSCDFVMLRLKQKYYIKRTKHGIIIHTDNPYNRYYNLFSEIPSNKPIPKIEDAKWINVGTEDEPRYVANFYPKTRHSIEVEYLNRLRHHSDRQRITKWCRALRYWDAYIGGSLHNARIIRVRYRTNKHNVGEWSYFIHLETHKKFWKLK